VITIEIICQNCGTSNPPGTVFCTKCKRYLGWDRSDETEHDGKPPTGTAPGPSAGSLTTPTGVQPEYTETICPSCRTINPGTRHFCSHCGYQFFDSDPGLYTGNSYITPESQAARDRAARRAYRRLLPPLYRWRRVIMVVLLATLGLVGGLVLGRDPVGTVKSGWYSLTKQYEVIEVVSAKVEPRSASAKNSDPAALVDETKKEWTMMWEPRSVSDCDAPEGTGVVVLTLAVPARIRLLQIEPGVDKTNPQHDRQAVPTRLGIKFDDGKCNPVNLAPNAEGQQEIFLDSKEQITKVRISIAAAKSSPNARPEVSITEVFLKDYPS
jgi:hypothetical protein